MKPFLVALAVFASHVIPLFATQQERDVIRYADEDWAIWEYPLSDYLRRLPTIPRFDVWSTANYKGYNARWTVSNSRLYLNSFGAATNGKPVSVASLFPDRKLPILADWYSGSVHILGGTGIRTNGYLTFKRVTVLQITNGVIMATNAMMNVREDKLKR